MIASPSEQRTHWHQEGTTEVRQLVPDALPARFVVVKHPLDHAIVLEKSQGLAKDFRVDAVNRPQKLEVPTWPVKQFKQDRHNPLSSKEREDPVDCVSPLCGLSVARCSAVKSVFTGVSHYSPRLYHSQWSYGMGRWNRMVVTSRRLSRVAACR